MMSVTESINRLSEIATQSLSPGIHEGCFADMPVTGGLRELLRVRNGFYAFGMALHVYPCGSNGDFLDIRAWNDSSLWRADYGSATEGFVFFAEDIFGVQFGIRNGAVLTFDPETGESEAFARDCEEWARIILSDYNLHTGYSLAYEWQRQNDDLPIGYRLVPKVPFVLGGAFDVANLVAMEAVASMKFRASIAAQITNLPDGSKVKLKFV